MDKIKQNIDLQEAIQRYNIEKSVVGTLAYNIDQNLQKGMSPDEAIENVLQKSKSMPIGTIHNGFKKIADGKWRRVSESHGYTKEEHGEKFREANKVALDKKGEEGSKKIADAHYLNYEKLDPKDYSDEEVTGGEKKEESKQKLTPKAENILSQSQNIFDNSNSSKRVELYEYVKKNIAIDKNGKDKIGMGLDEDLVVAGTKFIENNKDAYKEALDNINNHKEAKKERKESKTNKNVDAIEKLALQAEKEMQNKLK